MDKSIESCPWMQSSCQMQCMKCGQTRDLNDWDPDEQCPVEKCGPSLGDFIRSLMIGLILVVLMFLLVNLIVAK